MGRRPKPWFCHQAARWMVWLDGKKHRLAKGRKKKKAAEAHGGRRISECKPYHVEAWLDDHPEWASDLMKNSAIRHRVFRHLSFSLLEGP